MKIEDRYAADERMSGGKWFTVHHEGEIDQGLMLSILNRFIN